MRSASLAVPARPVAAVAAALVLATALAAASSTQAGTTWTRSTAGIVDPGLGRIGAGLQQVIVTSGGGVSAAADAVRRVGGVVRVPLDLVDGVSARVPADALTRLAGQPGVRAVTADRAGALSAVTEAPAGKGQRGAQAAVEVRGSDASPATGTVSAFVHSTQADTAWARGFRGQGVGVAVIDSGVSPVPDLAGRLVHGPDLSGEGTTIDAYGHGTVVAGAIAGSGAGSAGAYSGVAPRAHVVAVKVAGRNGSVDVSTVLQAMHFVSAYREQLGIRVLNLSWGVHSTQAPEVDPLSYAVQRLWHDGIVVVVAAGNAGPAAGTITKPADDPLVISVGAYDDRAPGRSSEAVPAWSSVGPTAAGLAKPDLVAPGRTVVATRSYGSTVEGANPSALVGADYIKGSGTSEASAVTAGLAAVLLSARPELTPDQVKHLLTSTADPLKDAGAASQGAGRVRLVQALTAKPGPAHWQAITAAGTGSLEQSRGGEHVLAVCDDVATVVEGEMDARCQPFDAAAWSGSAWTGAAWTGTSWSGTSWNGTSWNGTSWNGTSWNGTSWNGGTWTGTSWNGGTWTGTSWNGTSWNGTSWNGTSWNGTSWNGTSWNGTSWNGTSWNGTSWNGTSWNGTSWSSVDDSRLQTVFYGDRPASSQRVAGEVSEERPGRQDCVVHGTPCP